MHRRHQQHRRRVRHGERTNDDERRHAALDRRTEGWIAGLQLAAISMQGRGESSEFIKSFTGSHHFVLDYLVEEVLQQQPEEVRQVGACYHVGVFVHC